MLLGTIVRNNKGRPCYAPVAVVFQEGPLSLSLICPCRCARLVIFPITHYSQPLPLHHPSPLPLNTSTILSPTHPQVSFQKCIQLTDLSLCSIADSLWLEYIDLTGCYRVTDEGIDVLTMACTGLQEIHLRRCAKVGPKGIICVGRNVRNYELRVLDVRDCPRVTAEAVEDLVANQPMVTIL